MEPSDPEVKPKRRYDASGRRAEARRNRDAVITAAGRSFLTVGYAATTVASIAAAADVSVDMIYKTFGGKPGLVRAIRDKGLGGAGPVHAEQRSDEMRGRETDPRTIIGSWGRFTAEVSPLVAPILLLVRDASALDPQMAELRQELDDDRRTRMEVNARHLAEHGHLRPGITTDEATDILWSFSSPELYELFVLRRGWSADRYGRFVAESLTAALL